MAAKEVQLFEYAIILQPLVERGKVVEQGEILARDTVLTTDQEKATLLAGRQIPEEHLGHLERVTLAVRPF